MAFSVPTHFEQYQYGHIEIAVAGTSSEWVHIGNSYESDKQFSYAEQTMRKLLRGV